jgi:hypothetical protein
MFGTVVGHSGRGSRAGAEEGSMRLLVKPRPCNYNGGSGLGQFLQVMWAESAVHQ